MKQRDAVLVLASVVLAIGVAAILLVGSLSSSTTAGDRQRFYLGGPGRLPPARASGEIPSGPPESGRLLPARPPEFGRLPEPFRPLVSVERRVADASRDAAGYLLVLLLVSATIVLGRDQVLATYRASLGGWRAQARILGAGAATLALIASATFLTAVVFLGTLTGGFGAPRPFGPALQFGPPLAVQFGLQAGFVGLSVLLFVVALPTLVGFAAACWRLGDALVGLGPVARWGAQIPAPVVALLGATVLYVLVQAPYVGIVSGVGSVAYALGAVVTARLDPAGLGRPGAGPDS